MAVSIDRQVEFLPENLKVVYVTCKINNEGKEVYYHQETGTWINSYAFATHYDRIRIPLIFQKSYFRQLIKQV